MELSESEQKVLAKYKASSDLEEPDWRYSSKGREGLRFGGTNNSERPSQVGCVFELLYDGIEVKDDLKKEFNSKPNRYNSSEEILREVIPSKREKQQDSTRTLGFEKAKKLEEKTQNNTITTCYSSLLGNISDISISRKNTLHQRNLNGRQNDFQIQEKETTRGQQTEMFSNIQTENQDLIQRMNDIEWNKRFIQNEIQMKRKEMDTLREEFNKNNRIQISGVYHFESNKQFKEYPLHNNISNFNSFYQQSIPSENTQTFNNQNNQELFLQGLLNKHSNTYSSHQSNQNSYQNNLLITKQEKNNKRVLLLHPHTNQENQDINCQKPIQQNKQESPKNRIQGIIKEIYHDNEQQTTDTLYTQQSKVLASKYNIHSSHNRQIKSKDRKDTLNPKKQKTNQLNKSMDRQSIKHTKQSISSNKRIFAQFVIYLDLVVEICLIKSQISTLLQNHAVCCPTFRKELNRSFHKE